MNKKDIKKRIEAAEKILSADTTSIEKIKSVHSLLSNINPKLDAFLEKSLKAVNDVDRLQKGEIIELAAVNLPEKTDEQKKRKKAVIFLINTFKDLRNELERVKSEFEDFQKENPSGKAEGVFKIAYSAKGIFGITTVIAVLIVGALIFTGLSSQKNTNPDAGEENTKTKVIIFEGKQIPLTQLRVGKGPECDQEEHYHALDRAKATALDGVLVPDPGGCGFGKVKDTKVIEVE